MTLDEAIERLNHIKIHGADIPNESIDIQRRDIEALDMAIKALEKEDDSCEPNNSEIPTGSTTKNNLAVDCISRADARSLICKIDLKHHMSGMSRKAFKDLYNGIDELPSVTPIRPKGHWIKHEHNGIGYIECSECLCWFLEAHLLRNSHCPNCGSRNEVRE